MKTKELNLKSILVKGIVDVHQKKIISQEALNFLRILHLKFDNGRKDLLKKRKQVQAKLDQGWQPDFLEETKQVRETNWKVAPLPEDLWDRRVEITGPVDRKMIINALNSGAKVFMADFEDSNAPSWKNVVEGQVNLYDAIRKTISFKDLKKGKSYQLNDEVATLIVRPRGLHLEEQHVSIDKNPVSASLFDFAIYFINNAEELTQRGSAPYFYLPKLESYLEARWWNEIFTFSEDYLKIPRGTIKATVLIETILASYQMDEILYELKEHSAGLNCGRWDYIFSFIKRFRNQSGYFFPDRDQITMTVPFMRAYSLLLIKTCHRRKVHAMGGMAAQIPIKGNPEANEKAFEKVRADKLREANDGHDGTWVAHPALVATAMEVFDEYMPAPNQIELQHPTIDIAAQDLIAVPQGTVTQNGVRKNINVGIQYLAAWLSGNGAAAIFHLMEDAATAEISRTQVWYWLHNEVVIDDGRPFNKAMYEHLFKEELEKIQNGGLQNPLWRDHLEDAATLFNALVINKDFEEFLTIPAYQQLNN